MMACPTPDRLLGFASGELSDDESATIESHIDSCGDCRAVLSNHARGDVPATFGRYRLDTVLGSGGMGIVYRAWDPQLARSVAIKVVRRAADDTTGRARLVREAQSLARLSHPNVCHVYDVGTEGDEVWVAMELIDGVTLREWAASREGELLDVLLGAAEGIGAAHGAGLVHRDIKPENVLVTRDGRAIVTDFGLARGGDAVDPIASTLSTDPHLTSTGAIVGTPAYLAPEQLTGDPISAGVDQFAWAVMAWELLTGSRPFPVVFALRVDAIRAGVTPPPTLAVPIAAALVRALSLLPRDRFGSMRELIEAIRAPVRVPRRRAPMIAGLAVAVASTIAIGAWKWPTNPSPSPSPSPEPAVAIAIPEPTPEPKPDPVAQPKPIPKPDTHHAVAKPAAIATSTQPPPTTLTPAQTTTLINALDPPLRRSGAISMMDTFCHIPYDAAHPDPATRQPIVDWGTVKSVEREIGTLRDADRPMQVITAVGQRATVRFADEIGTLGRLETKPGAMLAWCADREATDIFRLPNGPITPMTSVVPIVAPPRIVELAKLQPLHIDDNTLSAAGSNGKLGRLAADRRYLVHTKIGTADGARWQMDRWWLEVPAGIRGASLVATGKNVWIVVEQPVFEDQPEGKPHLVLRAAAVVDEIFP